ncbi:hypothetical protein MAFF211271_45970 (plasmid) [Ralstonia syzygii subsp. indonesiensis]|nr:hypothetical protein MAFF211271_45970 [Ralstonia pseudosolanacearum]
MGASLMGDALHHAVKALGAGHKNENIQRWKRTSVLRYLDWVRNSAECYFANQSIHERLRGVYSNNRASKRFHRLPLADWTGLPNACALP